MNFILTTICSIALLIAYQKASNNMPFANSIDKNKMLIVISCPSIKNDYYTQVYDKILAFDIAYAKSIIGKDNVVVLGDAPTIKYLAQHLPQDILLEQQLEDIWLRDCSTVNPDKPVQFRYAAAAQAGKQKDADYVQDAFNKFANKYDLSFDKSSLILDGGNYVDNYNGRAIVSDRFLKDNNISYSAAKKKLQKILHLKELAIIPTDDSKGLAHADGQVMFIEENTVLVNDYNDPAFQKSIHKELENAFPGINIIMIPTEFEEDAFDSQYGSACGIHVNSTVTKQHIYFPIFNKNTDKKALQILEKNTTKTIVPIDASNVCNMGGSIRCLSWQLVGENAEKLIKAARG